MPKTQSERNQN